VGCMTRCQQSCGFWIKGSRAEQKGTQLGERQGSFFSDEGAAKGIDGRRGWAAASCALLPPLWV